MYATPERLAELVIDAQENRRLSDEFIAVLYAIADGACWRLSGRHSEDARQEFALWALTNYDRIDARNRPFNYLTTVALHLVCALHKAQVSNNSKMHRFADRMARGF